MTTKCIAHPTLLLILLAGSLPSLLFAEEGAKKPKGKLDAANTVEVEVKRNPLGSEIDKRGAAGDKEGQSTSKVSLKYVTYSQDRSLFVGYFQDGWFERVSLHDAKTKKQLASVSCDGGVPTVFRISKDNQFLGAKTGVGWYVWKIPSFEKVFVLGDIDIDRLRNADEEKDDG